MRGEALEMASGGAHGSPDIRDFLPGFIATPLVIPFLIK